MPLWDFYLDYGRQGELSGTFEATEEQIKEALGKTIWWDEELGKHSQGDFVLTEDMISPHEDTIRGFDPLEHIEEEDNE